MHEMALAHSIVELVQEHAARDRFACVRSIRLSIGALSHVDPRALEFGLEVATRGTVADGARLVIDRPGGAGFCTDCCKTVEIAEYGGTCPSCGGNKWMLVAGDEMRVVDLEVD
jgi:hydrogenase nickel incorporation protein HypA/HybF